MTPIAPRKSLGVSSLSVLVVTFLKNTPDFCLLAPAPCPCAAACLTNTGVSMYMRPIRPSPATDIRARIFIFPPCAPEPSNLWGRAGLRRLASKIRTDSLEPGAVQMHGICGFAVCLCAVSCVTALSSLRYSACFAASTWHLKCLLDANQGGDLMTTHLPTRLHHNAYVTRDMEATRHFYEDLIGMPLVATWCESDQLFGKERVYCHCFFGLADGSALAFFQFAHSEDQELFGPPMPSSPFQHIAVNVDAKTQALVEKRLAKAGMKEPKFYVLEHGYCRSIYATDP